MNREAKRREYGEKYALWLRNYQRARTRALSRLAREYPDQYKEFLEQERAKDEAEGKTWLDLSGRTKRTMDSAGTPDRTSGISKGRGNSEGEGNNGGEA